MALANMKTIAKQLEQQYPADNRGQGASVLPLSEVIVRDIRPIFLVLLAGAGPVAGDCLRECVQLVAGALREPQA